jgi:hypothetical protein
VTTSRSPSSRLAAFSKEIRLLMPTAIRLNRGNTILPELVRSCNSRGLSDVVLLHEHRGTPTAMTVSHLPHGPTVSFSLHNVVLRHDIPNSLRGTVSESYPQLIFEVSCWHPCFISETLREIKCERPSGQCIHHGSRGPRTARAIRDTGARRESPSHPWGYTSQIHDSELGRRHSISGVSL